MSKFASIDIGSNTLLLLIVDDSSGELVAIVDECDFGRLGQGLAHSSTLHPDAVARSLKIVRRYRDIMQRHDLARVACVGTQALREATNRIDFVGPAEEILGCPIEIIDGKREAQLVARAVIESFPQQCTRDVLCVDVGGASTEFIHIAGGVTRSVISVPIGAVRLTELYLPGDPPSDVEIQRLYGHIDTVLAELDLPTGAQLVGSAGTATTIASIHLELCSYQPERIHGYEMSREVVEAVVGSLLSMPHAERKKLPGLEPKRADIIAGGVAIYSRAIQAIDATSLLISDKGVRWGLAYELDNAASRKHE